MSLGYDVPHDVAERLLLKAATDAGLGEPFVLIDELGNFSIGYTVAGFLADTRHLVSAETNLRRAMLDALHAGGIEIASPALMTQRRLRDGEKIVPVGARAPSAQAEERVPENVVFDKAEQAERIEAVRRQRDELAAELDALKESLKAAPEPERAALEARIDALGKRIRAIDESLAPAD